MEDNFEAIFPLDFQVSCICEVQNDELQFYLGSQDGQMFMVDDTTGEVTKKLSLANESDQILRITKLESKSKLFLETKLGFRIIYDLLLQQVTMEVEDRGCIGFATGIIVEDKEEYTVLFFSPKIDKIFKVIEFDLLNTKLEINEYPLLGIKEDIPVLDCCSVHRDKDNASLLFLLENNELVILSKKNDGKIDPKVDKLQLCKDDYIGFKAFQEEEGANNEEMRILLQGIHSLKIIEIFGDFSDFKIMADIDFGDLTVNQILLNRSIKPIVVALSSGELLFFSKNDLQEIRKKIKISFKETSGLYASEIENSTLYCATGDPKMITITL